MSAALPLLAFRANVTPDTGLPTVPVEQASPPRRSRGGWIAASVVFVALAVIVAAVASTRGGPHSDVSPLAIATPFSLAPVIAGQPAATLNAVPGHPVVLTFFASWCQPCTEELPLIERLSRTGTVEVVGIDELDQRPDGPDMVRQTGVTFPSGYDHDGSVGAKWDVNGLPITVFIGADGRVVDYHRGQLRQAQLDALVRRLEAAG